MKGGYIMIDCKGLNLLSQSSVTVSGLHAAVTAAISKNKPIYAYNCTYGSGVKMTPIQVMCIIEDGTAVCTSSILQIRVAANDAVTITSLLN